MKWGKPDNPFAVHYVDPRTTPYEFVDARAAQAVFRLIEASEWTAELVGAHGIGKSTLLHTLTRKWENESRSEALSAQCNDQIPLPPLTWWTKLLIGKPGLVAVDGAERMPQGVLWFVDRLCRRRGIPFLSTAHRPRRRNCMQLTLQVQPHALARLVSRLQRRPVSPRETEDGLMQCQNNARDYLLQLYDRYEHQPLSEESVSAPVASTLP